MSRCAVLTLCVQSDVTGQCETKYVISRDVTMTSTLLVTAIRNFDRCVKKPRYVDGPFAGVYASRSENVRYSTTTSL